MIAQAIRGTNTPLYGPPLQIIGAYETICAD